MPRLRIALQQGDLAPGASQADGRRRAGQAAADDEDFRFHGVRLTHLPAGLRMVRPGESRSWTGAGEQARAVRRGLNLLSRPLDRCPCQRLPMPEPPLSVFAKPAPRQAR